MAESKPKKEKAKKDTQSKESIKHLETQLADLQAKFEGQAKAIAQEKDRALRAMAEMENFKKRKETEIQTFRKYAVESFVKDLLPILDSFDQATAHAKNHDQKDAEIIQGFIMIHRQVMDVLNKIGVTPIKAENEAFDPNLHQAVSQQDKKGVEPDVIIQEMQKGYILNDRVIRPSMVIVSK